MPTEPEKQYQLWQRPGWQPVGVPSFDRDELEARATMIAEAGDADTMVLELGEDPNDYDDEEELDDEDADFVDDLDDEDDLDEPLEEE